MLFHNKSKNLAFRQKLEVDIKLLKDFSQETHYAWILEIAWVSSCLEVKSNGGA
jgi:hypothetical protein